MLGILEPYDVAASSSLIAKRSRNLFSKNVRIWGYAPLDREPGRHQQGPLRGATADLDSSGLTPSAGLSKKCLIFKLICDEVTRPDRDAGLQQSGVHSPNAAIPGTSISATRPRRCLGRRLHG